MFGFLRRASGGDDGDPPETSVFVAMLALAQPILPEPGAIQSLLRLEWRDKPRFSAFRIKEQVVVGEIGKAVCAISLVQSPIPEGDLEAALAGCLDDDLRQLTAGRASHVICSVAGPVPKVEAAIALTKLVATASCFGDCRGIYWGAAPMVHPPDRFVLAAREMTPEVLPLRLWIRFEVDADQGQTSLLTRGMASLGFMEIEIIGSRRSAEEVEGFAFNFAHYLLDHGPAIKDGNTFGFSATEKNLVRHLPSTVDPEKTVYRIEY